MRDLALLKIAVQLVKAHYEKDDAGFEQWTKELEYKAYNQGCHQVAEYLNTLMGASEPWVEM